MCLAGYNFGMGDCPIFFYTVRVVPLDGLPQDTLPVGPPFRLMFSFSFQKNETGKWEWTARSALCQSERIALVILEKKNSSKVCRDTLNQFLLVQKKHCFYPGKRFEEGQQQKTWKSPIVFTLFKMLVALYTGESHRVVVVIYYRDHHKPLVCANTLVRGKED